MTAAQLNVPSLVAPPYTHATTFAFDPHLQLPYSWQWNLSLEQALGNNQSVTLSYVGANGRRLLQEERRDVNQLNPEFGDVSYFPSGLISNFDSLQVKFQRSFSRGIEALASYTWAHALDFGSTDPAFPLKYGDSDLDVRQNFEAAACGAPLQRNTGSLANEGFWRAGAPMLNLSRAVVSRLIC